MESSKKRTLVNCFKDSIVRVRASLNGYTKHGTAFFVSNDGILLTCNHVVSFTQPDPSGYLTVRYFPKIEIIKSDASIFPVRIFHDQDSSHPIFEDYAILKADIKSVPLHLCDPNLIQPGDDIVILGYPFNFDQLCVTSGVVSAKHYSPSIFNNLVKLDMIRIDGSVNIGNSGGPLIDLYNQLVVGIVSIRYGSITEQLERLKENSDLPRDLIDLFETIDRYMNVGIGEAISIRYALNELRRLGIMLS